MYPTECHNWTGAINQKIFGSLRSRNVCRCWSGTFCGSWSHYWVPNFGSTTFIYPTSGILVWSREVVHNQSHREELMPLTHGTCFRRILNNTWSERVTNFEVPRRRGQPLDIYCATRRAWSCYGHVAPADKSQVHSRALYKPAYRPIQGTGGGVQVVQDIA